MEDSVPLRLKALMTRAGFSMAGLAREMGYQNPSSIQRYLDEQYEGPLQLKKAREFASALKGRGDPPIRTDEVLALAGDDVPRLPIAKPSVIDMGDESFVAVARFDASLSAGPGSLVDPNAPPLGYHLVERHWLRALTHAAPEHLAVVKVAGDSMDPTLKDGDWVLVDRLQTHVSREGIYAIQVGEFAWVKRLSLNLREQLIRIISDNPTVPMQEVEAEGLHLIGRVISLVARKVP